MIGSLSGVVGDLETDGDNGLSLTIDVNGVGYRVVVGPRLAGSLGPIGSPVALAIHTHVREGAITLYGFADTAERRSFEVLLGAHGVGPSLALAILSTLGPATLAEAVVSGDIGVLIDVPGVGRKTAQRLIVDLAQRFEGSLGASTSIVGTDDAQRHLRSEARAALVALGYGPTEIRSALDGIDDGTVEDLVRHALRELAPQ